MRVSDVALAGLADNYRTRTSVDAARYLSPEQVLAQPTTGESDVYALALILFEAVTGSAAYEGSTAESVMRARLDTPLPVRLELGTLDMVLAQAAVPDPRLRLDAEQFSLRLGAVVGDPSPFVARPAADETPLLAQFDAVEPRRSIGFTPPSPEQITSLPNRGGRLSARHESARGGDGVLGAPGTNAPIRRHPVRAAADFAQRWRLLGGRGRDRGARRGRGSRLEASGL